MILGDQLFRRFQFLMSRSLWVAMVTGMSPSPPPTPTLRNKVAQGLTGQPLWAGPAQRQPGVQTEMVNAPEASPLEASVFSLAQWGWQWPPPTNQQGKKTRPPS